jgi:hypothetical protein
LPTNAHPAAPLMWSTGLPVGRRPVNDGSGSGHIGRR